MKKLLFVALAAVAMVFASCSKDNTEAVVNQVKAAIEQQDATVLQDALNGVSTKVQELVAENPEQAKELFTAVQQLLKENADKIKAFVGDNAAVQLGIASFTEASADEAIDLIQKVSEQKKQVEEAADAVKEAAENAKEAIENAPEAVKEAGKQAVEDAKAKANEKVNEEIQKGKDKANEKIDKGVSDVKKQLGL